MAIERVEQHGKGARVSLPSWFNCSRRKDDVTLLFKASR